MTDIEAILWFAAFIVWTFAAGSYLAGVAEFRDWRWPRK